MQTLAPFARLLSLLVIAVSVDALRADPTLAHARRAQEMLGPETWSRIVRIENDSPQSRYPRVLHALIFELQGVLWFYASVGGTQSLSLHVGRSDEEKHELGTLLREIDAGFRNWRDVNGDEIATNRSAPLPNGCFIDSVVALRERVGAGEPIRNPRLLSYYVETREGLAGHTVLVYDRIDRIAVFDAAQPYRRIRLPLALGADPLKLARALEGARVLRVRELKLDSVVGATIFASAAPESGALATARSVALR